MDDLVKWALELVNKVSGPGKDVVRALQRIRQAGQAVDASMNRAAEAIGMRGMGRAALTALTGLPKVIGKGARSMLEAAESGVSSLAAGGAAAGAGSSTCRVVAGASKGSSTCRVVDGTPDRWTVPAASTSPPWRSSTRT